MIVLQNTTGPTPPAAVAAGVVDLLLPETRRPNRPFAGELEALVGTYRGPGRGSAMEVDFEVEEGARKAGEEQAETFRSLGGGRFAPLESDGFGAAFFFVDAQGRVVGTPDAGTPVAARYDGPGAHCVLTRQN